MKIKQIKTKKVEKRKSVNYSFRGPNLGDIAEELEDIEDKFF
jgi:hypothetical protein